MGTPSGSIRRIEFEVELHTSTRYAVEAKTCVRDSGLGYQYSRTSSRLWAPVAEAWDLTYNDVEQNERSTGLIALLLKLSVYLRADKASIERKWQVIDVKSVSHDKMTMKHKPSMIPNVSVGRVGIWHLLDQAESSGRKQEEYNRLERYRCQQVDDVLTILDDLKSKRKSLKSQSGEKTKEAHKVSRKMVEFAYEYTDEQVQGSLADEWISLTRQVRDSSQEARALERDLDVFVKSVEAYNALYRHLIEKMKETRIEWLEEIKKEKGIWKDIMETRKMEKKLEKAEKRLWKGKRL